MNSTEIQVEGIKMKNLHREKTKILLKYNHKLFDLNELNLTCIGEHDGLKLLGKE